MSLITKQVIVSSIYIIAFVFGILHEHHIFYNIKKLVEVFF